MRFPASVLTADMISAICSVPQSAGKMGRKQQHCGKVAHQIGKNRDDDAERDGVSKPPHADPFDRIVIDASCFEPAHHDEQSREHQEHRPIDHPEHPFRFEASREEQDCARAERH